MSVHEMIYLLYLPSSPQHPVRLAPLVLGSLFLRSLRGQRLRLLMAVPSGEEN